MTKDDSRISFEEFFKLKGTAVGTEDISSSGPTNRPWQTKEEEAIRIVYDAIKGLQRCLKEFSSTPYLLTPHVSLFGMVLTEFVDMAIRDSSNFKTYTESLMEIIEASESKSESYSYVKRFHSVLKVSEGVGKEE